MSKNKAYWRWDIKTGIVEGGQFLKSLLHVDSLADSISVEDIKKGFSEESLNSLRTSFKAHLENKGEEPLQCETTHQISEVETISVLWFGEVISWSKDGEPLQMAGLAKRKVESAPQKKLSTIEAFLFFRLMDHLNESIFFKDLESKFIRINKECARKFGFNHPEKAIGKSDFDIFSKEHAQQAFDDEQRIIATEEPIFQKVEKETFPDDPEKVFWASTSKLPLYDEDGELIGTFGITRNITEQKALEEELERSHDLFSKLSELAPGFLFVHQVDDNNNIFFPFASEGIREMFALSPEDIKGSIKPLIRRVHRDDIKRVLASIMESVHYVSDWNCEYRIIHPEKGLRWIKGKATPVLQKEGTVLSPGYLTDITEEKKVYEANEELKKQFQSVFNAVPNLIFVKDEDGKYVMANSAACKFFGKEIENLIGKTDFDLGISPKRAQAYLEADAKVISTQEPLFFPEIKTKLESGSELWHQTIKVPFQQIGDSKPAVLTIVTNITERKRKELELNETLDIIGQQNQRLTNFAHIVSHNLRNHAGNISMLLTLYDPEESEEEQQEILGYLSTASERLNESIADLNEIVDQQQKTVNQHKKVNLKHYVEKTKEILITETLAHNVSFEEDIEEELTFEYNPAYLESIILNMFSNSIKYRKPEVRPEISVKGYKRKKHIYLEISDNGLGIDMEKHGEKLFGMYKTFHNNENSKGIGLFITKNQVESMGGRIEVESKVGVGTTFKIRLK